MQARVLELQSFEEDSLQLKTVELPAPAPGQVLLRMEASPIHPADLLLIQGKYGSLPKLPAVIGNEGVGKVLRCGPGVDHIHPGDLVLPGSPGMWAEARLVEAKDCILLPKTMDVLQAAQIAVAPLTAYWMLTTIVPLSGGSWVAQNAANSAVGRCVIQIARCLGLKTFNVVRRPGLEEELKSLGADVVVVEEQLHTAVQDRTCVPILAFNTVGGQSALALANILAAGGTHVTYGAMSRQPFAVSTDFLIYKNLTFKGFWRTAYWNFLASKKRQAAIDQILDWMTSGYLHLPVEKAYPLEDFGSAIAHAQQERKSGKVLFTF